MNDARSWLWLPVLGLSCAAPSVASAPRAEAAVSVAGPLRLASGRGPVEIRQGGAWRRLAVGETVAGASQLRALAGAVLVKSDAAGTPTKLWLRAGAEIELAPGAGDVVQVDLHQGDLRVHTAALDQMLYRQKEEAPLVRAEVAEQPEAADWSVRLDGAPEPAGVGVLAARLADGRTADLELRALRVSGRTAGDFIETEVEHIFHNAADARLEGTFRFPLPDGAILTGLAMEIDGRLMEGELVERQKAKEIYDKIVDEMQDPALLEWEEGNQLKLRVFPIQPNEDKRVVLRYLAPLRRGLDGWELVYETSAPALQERIPSFRLELDGVTKVVERDFAPGREIVVPVAHVPSPAARERREDAVYTAVRVRPTFAGARAPSVSGPRRLAIVVDRSRSALESRRLTEEAVRALLAELGPGDQVRVAACDIACVDLSGSSQPALRSAQGPGSFETAVPQTLARVNAFVAALDYDGATDFDLAIRHGVKMAGPGGQLVYIGDGTATWGVTAPEVLHARARAELGETPLYAIALGKGASLPVLETLAGESGGRVNRPRTVREVRRFALFLAYARSLRRLAGVSVSAEQSEVYPRGPRTLYPGDELSVVVRTPAGAPVPTALAVVSDVSKESIAIPTAEETKDVGKRWAQAHIGALEQAGEKDDEVVRTSLEFGVMSKKTSFLVLESDKMYAQFKIERRRAREAAEREARVTGGDLESLASARGSLSPDHIQPGDPEVRIPAPADARSVVVVFPFGETKVATYEPELGAWTVRFVIAPETRDGTYSVLVRITYASGEVVVERLSYVVDTHAPEVTVSVARAKDGFEIRARQVVTLTDLEQLRDEGTKAGPRALTPRLAQIVTDVRRVDVALPDGTVLPLTQVARGELSGVWHPAGPVGRTLELRVVATDAALNQKTTRVEVRTGE